MSYNQPRAVPYASSDEKPVEYADPEKTSVGEAHLAVADTKYRTCYPGSRDGIKILLLT